MERGGSPEKVTLLSEYGGDGRDVADPIGRGEQAYATTFEALGRYLRAFLETESPPNTRDETGLTSPANSA